MNLQSINQFLTLYIWFSLAILLLILLLIARFYEKFSRKRTQFRLFILPLVLFGMAAVRYAAGNPASGDSLGDVLSALAGVILILQCAWLYRLMIMQPGK